MAIKTALLGFIYRKLFKPIFFHKDPESVHDAVLNAGEAIGKYKFTGMFIRAAFDCRHPALEQNILGIQFANPIGLAAGFDKDARLINILPNIGFGFEEVGSVTAQPFEGNPKPRLWRLPEHNSLRVYYGLKNDGADIIHERLKKQKNSFPIGVSIAKTNIPGTSNLEYGIKDYEYSYKKFQDAGSYITINISCPNTCEQNPIFTNPDNLSLLLARLFENGKNKPVFIKLSPDLGSETLNCILDVSIARGVDGFVCTNLTKTGELAKSGKGGLSGKIVQKSSDDTISAVFKKTNGKKIIIGCGGIFSAKDAYKKISLGANLVQMITGMIYNGPQLIGEINKGLVDLIKKGGYNNVAQAVGGWN